MTDKLTITVLDANERHARVQIRGFGATGQRPLLGELTLTTGEWTWLSRAFASLSFLPEGVTHDDLLTLWRLVAAEHGMEAAGWYHEPTERSRPLLDVLREEQEREA